MATVIRGFLRSFRLSVSIAVIAAVASCAEAEELSLDPKIWGPVIGSGGGTAPTSGTVGPATTGSSGTAGRDTSVTSSTTGTSGVGTGGGGASSTTSTTAGSTGTTGGTAGTRGTGGSAGAGLTTGAGGKGGAGGAAGSSGGAGSAGRPTTDGGGGSRSTDAATCSTSCTIEVQYQNATSPPEPMTSTVRIRVDVFNNGTTAVSLANLTLRYWFTDQGGSGDKSACYYAADGCTTIATKFVSVMPARPRADRYLEFGFTSGGTLAPGAHTGTISLGVQHVAGGPMYNQTDDYSYGENQADFAPWPAITGYVGGVLTWGTEP